MQKIFFIVAICCAFCGYTNTAWAQTAASKVGHLNSQTFLEGLPEWQTAKTAFDTYMGMKRKMLEDMQKQVQTLAQQYQQDRDAGKLSPISEQKMAQEIQAKQAAFEKASQDAQGEVDAKEAELTEPIRKKIQEAINAVSRENGYTQIFDVSLGFVLYQDPQSDITALVRTKMGLPAAATNNK